MGVTPDWGGWQCPSPTVMGTKPNHLAGVLFANHTLAKNGGDSGDDIVWIPVAMGRDNHITMSAKCTFGTFMTQNYVIRPTHNKQTFWFRLDGTYKSN